MKRDFVSVVIPVYNGEKYIGRCIESVVNQSYKNIDIILINDNSNDDSINIINQYIQKKENNIVLINNEVTLGASESRNKGLKYVETEYVLFLDCDDWLDLNCIEKAICKFKENNEVDVVVWEIKTAYQHSRISSRYSYEYDNCLTSKMALSLLAHSIDNEYFLSPLLGCKLIKKEFLDANNIYFPSTVFEDDMFTFLTFLYSRKIALVVGSCLYYYQHPDSLTHQFSDSYIEDFFITFRILYDYIENNSKEAYYKYLDKSLKSMIDCMLNNISDSEIRTQFKVKIFKSFYENINVEEYYKYSFSLTI